jgi:hypothetical protein
MQFAGMNRAKCLQCGGAKCITYSCVCPQHIDKMRRYAFVLSRDKDSADDLVQETLLRAIKGASTWRPG